MELSLQNLLEKLPVLEQESESELEKNIINKDYYLERYINHPDAIECFKKMKKNTQNYFDRHKIKELIKLITELPIEDEYDIGYKFPYTACEMLINANKRIQEMISFPEDDFNNLYKVENKSMYEKTNNEIENELGNIETIKTEINMDCDDKIGEPVDKNEKTIDKNNKAKDAYNNSLGKKEINQTKDKNKDLKENEIKNEKKEVKEVRKFNLNKHNDLLDTLLNFTLNEDSLSNDVLCGYFYKVISFLIENYLIDIFLYLFFVRKDALEQIVMHSYKRSFALISVKILNIEDNISKITENDKKNPGMIDMEFLKVKKTFIRDYSMTLLENVLISIDLDGMKDKSGKYLKDIDVENVIFLFKELIKVAFSFSIYFSHKITEHIFKILGEEPFSCNSFFYNEEAKNIYNHFIIMLTEILHNSSSAYQEKGKVYPEFDYEYIFICLEKKYDLNIGDSLLLYIPKILSSNYNESSEENKLGIHIIYLMDLVIEFFKYFKNKPNVFDFIILQSGFMEKSITYFFKYRLNNIYQSKFASLFTLYLEDSISHPLLTDYIFNKIKFPSQLVKNIQTLVNENKNGYFEFYKYKLGKKIISCENIYICDLLFKIQVACDYEKLDEEDNSKIVISNYLPFDFLNNEKYSGKKIIFKLPKYIANQLYEDNNLNKTLQAFILPKIKKFKGKLLCNGPIKPRVISNNNSNNDIKIKNEPNSLKPSNEDKNKNVKKEDSIDNYNDIYFWKTNNNISDDIKKKIESNINKGNCDDEDILLNIAMKLEKD